MSTHASPDIRHESATETTTDAELDSNDGEPAPIDPFDTHNAAATFGDGTDRLPNTVDEENAYIG
ncbi:hypothetical protein [Halosimplex sp. TS25]|uniref:hypothetical protein n=1 Tax=Halosimplex rarum TaxID=3396619 RepID=UPI0039ECE417